MKSLSLARPHAIMMVGIPGSGKTHFAKKFADTFNAPFINAEEISAECGSEEIGQSVAGLFVAELAKTGQTFVYEGMTATRTDRADFNKWARSKGYQPMLVWVQTDRPTAQDRTRRSRGIDRNGYADLTKTFSPPHPSEAPVVISGKHTYATQAKVVLNHLAKSRKDTATVVPERPATPTAAAPRPSRSIRIG